jgi:hypothetical protein
MMTISRMYSTNETSPSRRGNFNSVSCREGGGEPDEQALKVCVPDCNTNVSALSRPHHGTGVIKSADGDWKSQLRAAREFTRIDY